MKIKDTDLCASLLTKEGVKLLSHKIEDDVIFWELGGIADAELEKLRDAAFKPGFMIDRVLHLTQRKRLLDILGQEGFITKHQFEGGRYAKAKLKG